MGRESQVSCAYCGKNNISKDEIGLNKKFIDYHVDRMRCLACLAAYFETTEEELEEMIVEFKRQGCALFG